MDYFEVDLDERVEFYENVRSVASEVLRLQHEEAEANRKAAQKK